jgi:hypothetical protein
MEFGQFLVAAADVRVGRILRKDAALLRAIPMIGLVSIAHFSPLLWFTSGSVGLSRTRRLRMIQSAPVPRPIPLISPAKRILRKSGAGGLEQ